MSFIEPMIRIITDTGRGASTSVAPPGYPSGWEERAMNKLLIAAAVVAGAGGLAYAVNKKPDAPAPAFRSDRVLTAGGAPSTASSPAPAAAATVVTGASLPDGEYTCYGSGLRILIGMGFRVSGGRYKDLDGNGDGSVAIAGDKVNFTGGHLDGQQGREVQPNGTFRIASMASCEKTS